MNSEILWKFKDAQKREESSQDELKEPINLEEEEALENPDGQPDKAEEKLPDKVIHYVKKKELKNIPIIAYYFSASWCEHS